MAADAAAHPPGGGDLRIVFEDDALVVADKPAGLLAVPGRGEDKQDCLSTRLLDRHGDLRVVHRLDMATSGLMVFARGAAAQRRLGDAFAARAVGKRYVAVVAGRPAADATADADADGWSAIDLPLSADWPRRPRQKVDAQDGRPSLTRWRSLGHDPAAGRSRLLLEPVTGRTHQLRVHLSAIGHPICGDALYGGVPDGAEALDARLLLHAARLAFAHPASGAALVFESAVPF